MNYRFINVRSQLLVTLGSSNKSSTSCSTVRDRKYAIALLVYRIANK
ncbi:hypothetical protein [Hydrococcus rivularis]|nr:hypothetical protein [Hydrococcus rivularis]